MTRRFFVWGVLAAAPCTPQRTAVIRDALRARHACERLRSAVLEEALAIGARLEWDGRQPVPPAGSVWRRLCDIAGEGL